MTPVELLPSTVQKWNVVVAEGTGFGSDSLVHVDSAWRIWQPYQQDAGCRQLATEEEPPLRGPSAGALRVSLTRTLTLHPAAATAAAR